MPTKCVVLGEVETSAKELKPIEFVYYINERGSLYSAGALKPSDFSNIELVSRGYTRPDGLDMMFAYKEKRSDDPFAILFFGRWNDGVV